MMNLSHSTPCCNWWEPQVGPQKVDLIRESHCNWYYISLRACLLGVRFLEIHSEGDFTEGVLKR